MSAGPLSNDADAVFCAFAALSVVSSGPHGGIVLTSGGVEIQFPREMAQVVVAAILEAAAGDR